MPLESHEKNGLVWLTAPVLSGVRHGFSTRTGGVSPRPLGQPEPPPWHG